MIAPLEGLSPDISTARTAFPRGLRQPALGFRFSVDALLLACFARVPSGACILDLGAGCGVVGIGCLLRQLHLAGESFSDENLSSVTALDIQPEMVACCESNFASLGLQGHGSVCLCNVDDIRTCDAVGPESMDVVVCNPPYRRPGSGRASPLPEREMGLAEGQGGLADFLAATAYSLKNKASAYFVFTTQRLVEFLVLADRVRLQPKALRFIHGRCNVPAKTVLIQVVKNGQPDVVVQSPLILYDEDAGQGGLTADALTFCPFLGANDPLP